MTTEEKFHAAVNVIRSLPQNGSYQPSNELMLSFYAYFKQATQGVCTGSRPAFWELVARAKYDAWKRLGSMSKQEAMAKYVDELHTIVETMSYSDKVASFLDAPNNELDNLKMEDLQLIAGDVIERVISQPNSPLASREGSPSRLISSLSGSSRSASPVADDESDTNSEAEYVDTIETMDNIKKPIQNGVINEHLSNGHIPNSHKSRSKTRYSNGPDITQEMAKASAAIRADIDRISERVSSLEKKQTSAFETIKSLQRRKFRPSTKLWFFAITWPLLAAYLVNRFSKRRV